MSSRAGRALVVFSKAPELGKVKTRLRPLLSEQQCLELHVAFLKDALERLTYVDAHPYLYLSEDVPLPFSTRIPIRIQSGADLGARMENAFGEVLADHREAVIIGTDSPTLTPSEINEAFRVLNSADLVLGPTDDGGYYLIGAKSVTPAAFHNIPWGTSEVLKKTLAALQPQFHKVALLDTSYDIDHPEDLARLSRDKDRLLFANHTLDWLKIHGAR